jgi:hypothetical protein
MLLILQSITAEIMQAISSNETKIDTKTLQYFSCTTEVESDIWVMKSVVLGETIADCSFYKSNENHPINKIDVSILDPYCAYRYILK